MTKVKQKINKSIIISLLVALALVFPLQVIAADVESVETSQMVPLRYVTEAIGAKVEWEPIHRQVIVTRGQVQLVFTIDQNSALVNGQTYEMAEKATLLNGSTYIPLNMINEVFQADLKWSLENELIIKDTDLISKGSHFIYLLTQGDFSEAYSMLNEHLQAMMSEDVLAMMWANHAPFGELDQLLMLAQANNGVHQNITLTYLTSLQTPLGFIVRFDTNGLIDDLYTQTQFAGGYETPDYDNPELYTEKEVIIGEGLFALPATLTMPVGEKDVPAVVLVHGSGPSDRDESVGAYKPFRDFAVGLASQGIAVLRFEKRTFEHGLKSGLNPMFTVKEESVDDALAAIEFLQNEAGIDASQIYVLGHSQGGMLVPRIVVADENNILAGAIVAGSPADPLEDIILIQNYQSLELLKAQGTPAEMMEMYEQMVEEFEKEIEILKDPQYSLENPPVGLSPDFMGQLYWWLDIRNHYAAELSQEQTVPLFIIQGDNDFQVPGAQLDKWKEALQNRSDVAYKLYPTLNHFFVAVDYPSTVEEYIIPGNIPYYVIEDIAEWINEQK